MLSVPLTEANAAFRLRSLYILHVVTWHGVALAQAKRRESFTQRKESSHRYLHEQVQALIYLWLEKPNIAVMRSQSSRVPFCVSTVHKATGEAWVLHSLRLGVIGPPITPPATEQRFKAPVGVSGAAAACWGGTYLLGAKFRVALPHFAWTPFNDCIAEHSDDHDEQEVAGVHQVQVDEGAVVLHV